MFRASLIAVLALWAFGCSDEFARQSTLNGTVEDEWNQIDYTGTFRSIRIPIDAENDRYQLVFVKIEVPHDLVEPYTEAFIDGFCHHYSNRAGWPLYLVPEHQRQGMQDAYKLGHKKAQEFFESSHRYFDEYQKGAED